MGLRDWWHWLTGEQGSSATNRGHADDRGSAAVTSTALLDPPRASAGATEYAAGPSDTWFAPPGAKLLEPVRPERPKLSTEARALEQLLVSHFDGHNLSLPPLLVVADRVMPMLSDPNCQLGEVADEIASDPVTAAALLRMANSPLYRGVDKITSLQVAVSRLGIRALRMLLLHESLRIALFGRKAKGVLGEFAKSIWRRSLASGAVMRAVATFSKTDREDAFLMGLLHDIGNVIVLRVLHTDKSAQFCEPDVNTLEFLCYETHQEFGELIADAWRLPPRLKAIISSHHLEPATDDALRMERMQLQLTDMIISLLGYAPFAPYQLLETRVIRDLHLAQRTDFLAYLSRLPDDVTELVDEL